MLDPRVPWLAATAALLVAGVLPHDAAAQSRGGGGAGSGVSSGTGASRGLGGSLSTSPTMRAAPSTPTFTPGSSAIGTPMPQVAPVAPLSPAPGSNFLSGGSANPTTTDIGGGSAPSTTPSAPLGSRAPLGVDTPLGSRAPVGVNTPATSGGTVQTFPGGGGGGGARGSASPSETAPSTPGGGAPGVAACMGFWDAATHMNKREWAVACRRVEDRLSNLRSALDAAAQKSNPAAAAPKRNQRRPAPRARVSGAKSQ
jgi:hypothetical protein